MPAKYRNVFAHDNNLVYYRKRSNGVYEARYHRKGIDIEVSSKDFNTLKQKFIEALNIFAEKGNVRVKSQYTELFNNFAENWLKLKEKTTKPSTYTEYKRLYSHDIAPHFKDKMLADLDREFLQEFLFRYVEEGKNRTAEKLHLVLRCIFDLAADDYKNNRKVSSSLYPITYRQKLYNAS